MFSSKDFRMRSRSASTATRSSTSSISASRSLTRPARGRTTPGTSRSSRANTPSTTQARPMRCWTSSATTRRTRRVSPASRRPEDLLRHRRHSDAPARPCRFARAGEEALGRIGVDIKVNTSSGRSITVAATITSMTLQVWPGPAAGSDVRPARLLRPASPRLPLRPPWAHWYVSGGKDGQEPPESQKQRMKLFDEARATADRRSAARSCSSSSS